MRLEKKSIFSNLKVSNKLAMIRSTAIFLIFTLFFTLLGGDVYAQKKKRRKPTALPESSASSPQPEVIDISGGSKDEDMLIEDIQAPPPTNVEEQNKLDTRGIEEQNQQSESRNFNPPNNTNRIP